MIKKTKYGDYAKWIHFPVLANYSVRLIFTNDLANSFGKRLGGGVITGNTDACCFHTKSGTSYMFLSPNSLEGVIAHEAWHIIFELYAFIGVKVFENEITAYHLGDLISQIHKFKKEVNNAESKNANPGTKVGTGTQTTTKARTGK